MKYADAGRMLGEIRQLAEMSATPPKEGITRVSWTGEYVEGTDFIKRRMQEAGLEVWEDRMGNVCGCLRGEKPKGSILSGSHLDTVHCSGAFDGVMGVICALETARLLQENGIRLQNHYKVLAMAEEEGTRTEHVLAGSTYIRSCLETLAGVSGAELPDLETKDGKKLWEVIRAYKEAEKIKVPERPILKREKMVYVEVHDEQGPVLERNAMEIGIVDQIRGILNFEICLRGMSGHPGTVPMSERRDCSLAAYEICLLASRYVREYFDQEATITFGEMEIRPGSSNCIPGEAVFTVDIRFRYQETGEIIGQKVMELVREQQEKLGLYATCSMHMRKEPTPLDDFLKELIGGVCIRQKRKRMRIDSGAGHDAMNFAKICPAAMIFSPCKGGVSHNVQEFVSEKDIQNVTNVLYETILELDKEIGK